MLWFILAFGAAIFASGASVVQKKALMEEHAMEFSTILALFNMILSLPMFFFIDYRTIEPTPLFLTYIVSIFAAVAYLLVSKSVRHMEISSAGPLLVLGPGITALLAFLILGEGLTRYQLAGLLALIFGAYVLETKPNHDIYEPFRVFKKSKYIHFIVIALILYAFCSILDRVILAHYNFASYAYIGFVHLFLAMNFMIIAGVFYNRKIDILAGIKRAGVWILLVSIFTVGYRYLQMEAVRLVYVALVSAIKRTSVFFSTLIGGELFYEHNILRKSIATIIMIIGAVLIVL